jgi:hypothetical protein
MPIVERVISGQLIETNPVETVDNSSWETISNVGRDLNFALTVRDRSEANGVGQTSQSDFDTMTVTVEETAGPFVVTSQTAIETWNTDTMQTVTWDVAGTDTGAVNTPTVNILLSIDGGFTYPFVLATDVPNDGSHSIMVPEAAGNTTAARVKVEGNNTIFYAVNSVDFIVEESLSIDGHSFVDFRIYPNPNNGAFNLKGSFLTYNNLEVSIYDIRGRRVFENKFKSSPNFNEHIQLQNVAKGLYIFKLSDGVYSATKKIIIE